MHIYQWQIDLTPLLTPLSIEHRCLEYHYMKLGRSNGRSTPLLSQSSRDALNTAIRNLADLLALISGKPLHQLGFIYSTMPPPPLIEHRSLENHDTK